MSTAVPSSKNDSKSRYAGLMGCFTGFLISKMDFGIRNDLEDGNTARRSINRWEMCGTENGGIN
uniref:Uncharacterized protein n=1 Tax=Solanum lycopersicum TaxID=4081 RepID=A0A3Q7IT41_SOLLC